MRVGVVGFSDRFRTSLLPAFMANAKSLNFEIVAVSDIWSIRREAGKEQISKLTGKTIDAVRNNDELYDRKDVDAVFVATADFQHAQHGVEAVRAGRDAYVEKPMAHTMKDARDIRAAVRETNRIVQIGTQRRSSLGYQRARRIHPERKIRRHRFGADDMERQPTRPLAPPQRCRQPARRSDRLEALPDARTLRAIRRTQIRRVPPVLAALFRHSRSWMVHQIDTVHWFTGLPRPRSVVANGGIYLWHDGRKNWDTMTATFDYGPLDNPTKGFQVVYSSRMTNEASGVKEMYYSNGGTMDLDKKTVSSEGGLQKNFAAEMNMQPNLLPSVSLLENVTRTANSADTGGDPDTTANVLNWMECVRSRKTPNANIEAGYSHSIALCMTIAAIQTGRRITFDDAKQEVVIGS